MLVGEQFEAPLGKIPGVVIEEGLVVSVKVVELDRFEKAALGVIHLCQSIEIGEVDQRCEEAAERVDRKHTVQHPMI